MIPPAQTHKTLTDGELLIEVPESSEVLQYISDVRDEEVWLPGSLDQLLDRINEIADTKARVDQTLLAAELIVFSLTRRTGLRVTFNVQMFWEEDATGRVSARPLPFFAALLGILEGVELDRIKRCERASCAKYFYAKRKDKRGCSPACCNVINVTHSRALKAERAAQYQRARNRKRKNARKKGK